MDIVKSNSKDKLDKTRIEQVQKKKHEYYLLGQFLVKKGLTLYAYNSKSDSITKVKIQHSPTLRLYQPDEGDIRFHDPDAKVNVDSRNIHFQALNISSARKRVEKYKQGKIELFNLQKPIKRSLLE